MWSNWECSLCFGVTPSIRVNAVALAAVKFARYSMANMPQPGGVFS
jgi:hypothetical protein